MLLTFPLRLTKPPNLCAPAIFINPFIQPETIFRPPAGSPPFDHTSIIRTLCQQFSLDGPLTPRDQSAPTFAGLIDTENSLNPFSPVELPSFKCPKSKTPKVEAGEPRAEPRPDTIAAVIKQGMLSPKNQARVGRISGLEVG